jgi:hypothetical protein
MYVESSHTSRRSYVAALVLCLPLAGCIDWSYDRLRIGAGPADYARLLPDAGARRTAGGLTYFGQSAGRTDVIVVQLGEDRRVFGKWQATWVARLGRTGFRLRGAFAPQRAGLEQAGPTDVLRYMLLELATPQDDPLATTACGRMTAALLEYCRHWGKFDPPAGVTTQPAAGTPEVPAGGHAGFSAAPDGTYHFDYTHGTKP